MLWTGKRPQGCELDAENLGRERLLHKSVTDGADRDGDAEMAYSIGTAAGGACASSDGGAGHKEPCSA
jgi:hypothetical protein